MKISSIQSTENSSNSIAFEKISVISEDRQTASA